MKKFILKYAWCFYFGAILNALTGLFLTDWKWWVIIVPTLILETISSHIKD